MIISEDYRKCVMFLGYRTADEKIHTIGTAFLVGQEIGSAQHVAYLITARHVINGVKHLGLDEVLVRLNLAGERSDWFPTRMADWVSNPDDATSDVALYPGVDLPQETDHLLYPFDRFATAEVIANEAIGPGTDVFLAGLFVFHSGILRSVPIIRTGVIAAMPGEPVSARIGPMVAYLIEIRSVGGLSGSPVFANLGTTRIIDGRLQIANSPVAFLLGLVHGHFDLPENRTPNANQLTEERINTGIAIVTPVAAIRSLILHPVVAERVNTIVAGSKN